MLDKHFLKGYCEWLEHATDGELFTRHTNVVANLERFKSPEVLRVARYLLGLLEAEIVQRGLR